MNDLKIELMDVADLEPYAYNPRFNDDAVDAVAASIAHFGFLVPIVIDQNRVIIAGHTRLKAAEKLGLDRVPVIRADDMTEAQVREYRLVDNKTAELADWDFDALRRELQEVALIDMNEFGFMVDEILKIKEDHKAEKAAGDGSGGDDEPEKIYCPRCGALVSVEV